LKKGRGRIGVENWIIQIKRKTQKWKDIYVPIETFLALRFEVERS